MKDKNGRTEALQVEARDNILNSLDIAIYVTELATNEILFANKALQKRHAQPLVGRVCWEALENRTNRCESCPIPYLLKYPGKDYHRETYNGEYLNIYDRIIPWEKGKLAHLRYIVNIST